MGEIGKIDIYILKRSLFVMSSEVETSLTISVAVIRNDRNI
jgi:hypothetical protein